MVKVARIRMNEKDKEGEEGKKVEKLKSPTDTNGVKSKRRVHTCIFKPG